MDRVEVPGLVDAQLVCWWDGERVARPILQYRPGPAFVSALGEEGLRATDDRDVEGAVRRRLGVIAVTGVEDLGIGATFRMCRHRLGEHDRCLGPRVATIQ